MRKNLSTILLVLSCVIGFVLTILIWRAWSSTDARAFLIPAVAADDDALAASGVEWTLVALALPLLGYILSFSTRIPARPWALILPAFALAGAAAGAAAAPALNMVKSIDANVVLYTLGGAAALPAMVWGFEAANRAAWGSALRKLDAADRGKEAAMLGRVVLLFSPGQRALLRSVALESFRSGNTAAGMDLESFYQAGDRGTDLLELLCQHAAAQKTPEKYLQYLSDLQAAVPDDEGLREALIEELLAQNQQQRARALIEVGGIGKDWNQRAYERYAVLLLEAGDLAQATRIAIALGEKEGIPFRVSRQILQQVVDRTSEFVPALNALAQQADRMRIKEQRQRWLEKSYDADSRQVDVRDALLQILRESGQDARREAILAQAVGDNVTDPALAYEYSQLLQGSGRPDPARDILNKLHARDPRNLDYLEALARIEVDAGRLEEGSHLVEEALALNPPDARARVFNALSSRIERAVLSNELVDLTQRAAASPGDVDLQFELLSKLIERTQFERAVGHADTILQQFPAQRDRMVNLLQPLVADPQSSFILLNYLSDLLVSQGRLDEALKTVRTMSSRAIDPVASLREGTQKILRRSPHHLPTLRTLGDVYRANGHFTEMVHSYSLYLANGGAGDPDLCEALGKAYLSLDDFANAHKYMPGLLKGSAEDVPLLVRITQLAISGGNFAEAAEYLARLEALAPKARETRDLKTSLDQANAQQRLVRLKAEVEAGRGTQEVLEELGDMHRALGEFNEAITAYQRAGRANPAGASRSRCKLALALAHKRMFDLASETISEVTLTLDADPAENQVVMGLLYDVAEMFEEARLNERAARLYKTLLKVDASYRDVIAKVEKLKIS